MMSSTTKRRATTPISIVRRVSLVDELEDAASSSHAPHVGTGHASFAGTSCVAPQQSGQTCIAGPSVLWLVVSSVELASVEFVPAGGSCSASDWWDGVAFAASKTHDPSSSVAWGL